MPESTRQPKSLAEIDAGMLVEVERSLRSIGADPRRPLDERFRQAANSFFTKHAGSSDAHDAYFNEFSRLWTPYYDRLQFPVASRVLLLALEPALAWESSRPGAFVHKGTPYCWLAAISISAGDLDSGYLLAHRAVVEDERTTRRNDPDLPALALATINFEKEDQAFLAWVRFKAEFLERRLAEYRRATGSALSMRALRTRLLVRPELREPVFVLAHLVGRLARLASTPPEATDSVFGSQLRLQLLFDLSRFIEEALRARTKADGEFAAQAKALLALQKSALGASLKVPREDADKDFDGVLEGLLDGKYQPSGTTLSLFERCVVATYLVRNRGAHRLSSVDAIARRYAALEQALFNTLFFVVESFYP